MPTPKTPVVGFLVLGILGIATSVVFAGRATGCEATAEPIGSAVAFGAMGIDRSRHIRPTSLGSRPAHLRPGKGYS